MAMIRSFLPLAAILSTPLAAQEAPATPPVGYDDAVTCAFIAISLVMRDEMKPAEKKAAGALGSRYMEYAEGLTGKATSEVVADMAIAGDTVIADAKKSAKPLSDLKARYADCASKAKLF